jgi:hypothetical protein
MNLTVDGRYQKKQRNIKKQNANNKENKQDTYQTNASKKRKIT